MDFTAWEFELYCVRHDTRFDEPQMKERGTMMCPRCERPLRARHIETHKSGEVPV